MREETGFGPSSIEALFDLDQVNQFHEPSVDAIVTAAVFAVRVRPGSEAVLSHEHDALQWVDPRAALEIAVWPAYRESIRRIEVDLANPAAPDRAAWFRLELDGRRPVGEIRPAGPRPG